MADTSLAAEFNDLLLDDVEPTGVELGRGSFGLVFEVKWRGEVLAAKKLHDIFFESTPSEYSSKRKEEFMDECRAWLKFKHPNMVALRGLYWNSSHGIPVINIVMERMDVSLGDYLVKNPREAVPLHKKVSILLQVAQGLSYLHGHTPPFVHHDLKPDNVLLNTGTFTAKLSDFGMIRTIFLTNLTRMSSVKGTPVFMPPEALNVPPKYNEKLDVFSYGCVIISVLLHSKAPVPSGPTAMIDGELVAVSEYNRRKHHTAEFTDVEKRVFLHTVEKCLEFDAKKRPSSTDLVQEMTLIVAQPYITQVDTRTLISDLQANLDDTQRSLTTVSAEKEALSEENKTLSDTTRSLQQSQEAMNRQMVEASNLPEGWTATFAPNGRIVYVCHQEKKTQWTHPATGKPSTVPRKAMQRLMSEPYQREQRDTNVDPLYHSMPARVPTHRQPPSHSMPDSFHGSRLQPTPPPGSRLQPTPPPGSWPQPTPPSVSRFQPSPPPPTLIQPFPHSATQIQPIQPLPTQLHQAPPPYSAQPHTAYHDPSPGVHHWPYMPQTHGGMGYGQGYPGNYSTGYHDVPIPYESAGKVPSSMGARIPYEGGREVHRPQHQGYYANQDPHKASRNGRASGPEHS